MAGEEGRELVLLLPIQGACVALGLPLLENCVAPERALGSGACGAKGPAKAWSLRPLPKHFLTFLSDADGAAAHSHPQGIYTSINEVLGLSSRHHCREEQGKAHVKVYMGPSSPTLAPHTSVPSLVSPLPPMTWRLGYFSLMYLIMFIWKMEFPWEESWDRNVAPVRLWYSSCSYHPTLPVPQLTKTTTSTPAWDSKSSRYLSSS